MSPAPVTSALNRIMPIGMIVLTVAALHFGRELLEPFAIAALFTFLLAPAVGLLQRTRMPRVLAVTITVTVASCVVVGVLIVVVSQLDDLRGSLTQYRVNIAEKLSAIGGAVASIGEGLNDALAASPDGQAMAVRVVSDASPFALLGDVIGPLLDPLGTMAIVFVLVLFMLIYLEDLRDRIAYILNVRNVTVTIQASTEVSARISRYLLTTLLINVAYGVPVAIGLTALGIPNALLWGVLATLLRFIPYVGPWLAASMPVALSFAISPDWGPTLGVIGLFLTLELISNNLIEPWAYGSRTGLSPLAVIVAAVFWSWLWGLTGLFLSVPLTLILVVSGRHVRPLRFLYTLFGDGPGLLPPARFYQRLVADDADEAGRVAESLLDEQPLLTVFDTLLMPALRSLKFDEAAGWIQPAEASTMRATLGELVGALPAIADKREHARRRHRRLEDLENTRTSTGFEKLEAASRPADPPPTPTPTPDAPLTAAPAPSPAPEQRPARVTFIPAGDASDALVGAMLAELLGPERIAVTVVAPGLLTSELVRAGLDEAIDAVVIGGFLPGSLVRVRHLVSRITGRALSDSSTAPSNTRAPGVIVGLWTPPVAASAAAAEPGPARASSTRSLSALVELPVARPDPTAIEDLSSVGAHEIVSTLAEAADAVRSLLRQRELDRA